MLSKQLYISGELVEGQSTAEVINPATEKTIGAIAIAGVAEAEAAQAYSFSYAILISNRGGEWCMQLLLGLG